MPTPTPTDAQQAALDAYNIAVTHLNDAQAKMGELQTSARPADQAGQDNTQARRYDDDFRAAQAAVESAKSEAAAAARQYATILNSQANEAAKENTPVAQAQAEQNRAHAALYQARADGYEADTDAKRQQAQQRADAATKRAQDATDRVAAQNAKDTSGANEANARAAAIPAATANAAAGTAETARHNQVAESDAQANTRLAAERDKQNAAAAQAKIDYDNKLADITDRHNQGLLSVEQAKVEIDRAHTEASDAAQAARDANTAWFEHQQAANAAQQQATNAAQQAETTRANQTTEAETTRANQAREAEAKVQAAETQRANQARETQQGASTGAGILQNRITETSGLINQTLGPAMQSKNIGLGSMPDVSELPAAASAFITGLGGGQSTYDTAAALVHAANPQLAMTPAGAGYAAVLAQVQDAGARYGVGSAQQPNGPDNNFQTNEPGVRNSIVPATASVQPVTPVTPATAPITSIAPDGTVTIQHAPFAQSGIAEGSRR